MKKVRIDEVFECATWDGTYWVDNMDSDYVWLGWGLSDYAVRVTRELADDGGPWRDLRDRVIREWMLKNQ